MTVGLDQIQFKFEPAGPTSLNSLHYNNTISIYLSLLSDILEYKSPMLPLFKAPPYSTSLTNIRQIYQRH
ncbi:hypothetical protein MTR_8g077080 [Medicago truncatula]|uniref:Uncharacterized protein n=1 Tax=Medicago truncatula TaxID=3880 RepID=G7LDX7_MEDTR|nr:hypothetical protein MTR_8g077080 [Medicago truncatula]